MGIHYIIHYDNIFTFETVITQSMKNKTDLKSLQLHTKMNEISNENGMRLIVLKTIPSD